MVFGVPFCAAIVLEFTKDSASIGTFTLTPNLLDLAEYASTYRYLYFVPFYDSDTDQSGILVFLKSFCLDFRSSSALLGFLLVLTNWV